VRIGAREQAEIWDSFRVARHPIVRPAEFELLPTTAGGAMSPYHLTTAMHSRVVRRQASGEVFVRDLVSGADDLPATAFFHFHPDWDVRRDGTTLSAERSHAGRRLNLVAEFEGCTSVEVVRGAGRTHEGWFAERFGQSVPACSVAVEIGPAQSDEGRTLTSTLRVSPT
jgi:hypothetical protein